MVCGAFTRMPMVTPCAHLACLDCALARRTACPHCGGAYVMQCVDDPARRAHNPKPKWEVRGAPALAAAAGVAGARARWSLRPAPCTSGGTKRAVCCCSVLLAPGEMHTLRALRTHHRTHTHKTHTQVPLELIEWQPVYHQRGATGLGGGEWSANWEVTKSTKVGGPRVGAFLCSLHLLFACRMCSLAGSRPGERV